MKEFTLQEASQVSGTGAANRTAPTTSTIPPDATTLNQMRKSVNFNFDQSASQNFVNSLLNNQTQAPPVLPNPAAQGTFWGSPSIPPVVGFDSSGAFVPLFMEGAMIPPDLLAKKFHVVDYIPKDKDATPKSLHFKDDGGVELKHEKTKVDSLAMFHEGSWVC